MTTLTIEQAVALVSAMSNNKLATSKAEAPKLTIIGELGRPVIVRSRDAGVLFGEYAGNDGSTVHLLNARQMWRWHAAEGGTLIDCATEGVIPAKCKFSPSRASVTVFNACALIDCSIKAAASIRSVAGGKWE
jgi:hypothetical protein